MELQQLKYFKTVARLGKISDAAEALFVSPPALSTSISRLEKELGVSLFDRTGNRITLNAQGQIFLKHVDEVFASLDSAKTELRQSMLPQRPHLSLAILNSHMWSALIAAFFAEFPDYTLSYTRVSQEDFTDGMLPENLDFFLAYSWEIPPQYREKLDSIYLFDTQPAVFLHKDHPLSGARELTLSQIADQRLFLPIEGSGLYLQLQQLFARLELPFPEENAYSLTVRQRMVANNSGISFCSLHPDNSPLPDVRYIPLTDFPEPWQTCLFWRKDHPMTPQQQAFRDYAAHYYEAQH